MRLSMSRNASTESPCDCGRLIDAQIVILLHRLVHRDVFLDLFRRNLRLAVVVALVLSQHRRMERGAAAGVGENRQGLSERGGARVEQHSDQKTGARRYQGQPPLR